MVYSEVSVVLVGDQRAGKSTLINRFIWNDVSNEYKPTSFDKFSIKKLVNDEEIEFTIWDTSGSQAYDSVRPLSYNEADIFMVCFSVTDPCTLTNVRDHWIPEIKRHRPDAPILLCGCMARLRDDPAVEKELRKNGYSGITPEIAMQMCVEVGISIYVDTSAGESLKEVVEAFDMAALLTLQHRADRGEDERFSIRPDSSASGRSSTQPLGRPSSAAGRPGSAASQTSFSRSGSGASSSQGTGKRSYRHQVSCRDQGPHDAVGKVSNSKSFHGSYSNIPGNLSLPFSDQIHSLDLFHRTAPVHKQTRSLDSPAGETIHEDEVLNSSSNGTRSPRSLQKKSRPQSPLARGLSPPPSQNVLHSRTSPPSSPQCKHNQYRSLSPSSLPSSPSKVPSRPSLNSSADQTIPVTLRTTQSQQFAPREDQAHSRSISHPQPLSSLQQAILFNNRLEQMSLIDHPPDREAPLLPAKPAARNTNNTFGEAKRGEFSRQSSVSHNGEFSRQISNVSQHFGEVSLLASPDLDMRSKPPERNSQKTSFRTSLPAGRPPLPVAPLPKSPSDLTPGVSAGSPITQEPLPRRLAHLGVPDPKNYESLKSHTSTVSHGSTGSKISTASSLSGNGPLQFYSGPRDFDIPDTEDPELLKKLDFVSPKAGVYRPVHPPKGVKKDKCSMM